MTYGWAGTILHVDLTKEKIIKQPSTKYTKLFVGQRGVNAKLIYDHSQPGQSCFDPETPIIIGAGALAGTGAIGAAKLEITSRSPEQEEEGYANTAFGSYFASELKWAGYDNIVIKGRASKPIYLFIENDTIIIKDAKNVWGKGTFDTNTLIREELEDPDVKILAIGPAGEKLVRLATIEHEERSGTALGAVFGSKNLKAVVVRGTKGLKVYDSEKILEIGEKLIKRIEKRTKEQAERARKREYMTTSWPVYGVSAYRTWFETTDIGEVGQFEGFEWPDIQKTRGEPFLEKHKVARASCSGCPYGDMAWVKVEGVGTSMFRCYVYWLPWMVWTTDWNKIFEFTNLASDYGLDYRALGKTMAWLMQMYEKGIITEKDTDGLPMEKGNTETLLATIQKVAKREGFGDSLAEGALRFAKKLGSKAEEMLVHRRGILPRSVDMRVSLGTALGLAVCARGSTHRSKFENKLIWERSMKNLGLDEELKEAYARAEKNYGSPRVIIPWEYEGKAQLLVHADREGVINDMLGLCNVTIIQEYTAEEPGQYDHVGVLPKPHLLQLAWFNAATGMNVDEKWLLTTADRIINMERAFLVRDGRTRKMDTIPELFFREPIQDGPRKGLKINRTKFEKMKNEYYELRGWDIETGIPTKQTLEKLGLKDVADDLDKRGILPKQKIKKT